MVEHFRGFFVFVFLLRAFLGQFHQGFKLSTFTASSELAKHFAIEASQWGAELASGSCHLLMVFFVVREFVRAGHLGKGGQS